MYRACDHSRVEPATLVIVFTSAIALACVYMWVLLGTSDWPGRHGQKS